MTEKEIGCDNCYYSYFDERAYPCSLCIRGIERTDQWQPSKKTKADRKTENSSEKPNNCEEQTVECPFDDSIPCEWVCTEYGKCKYKPKTEPQTCDTCRYSYITCRFMDKGEPCHYEPKDEPQTDKEIILDPSFAELSDEQFVEAMKLIEPQTDCSWK